MASLALVSGDECMSSREEIGFFIFFYFFFLMSVPLSVSLTCQIQSELNN